MLDPRLLEILVCPCCKGDLEYHDGSTGDEMLECSACSLGYPVRDGIPIMLKEDAKNLKES